VGLLPAAKRLPITALVEKVQGQGDSGRLTLYCQISIQESSVTLDVIVQDRSEVLDVAQKALLKRIRGAIGAVLQRGKCLLHLGCLSELLLNTGQTHGL